MTTGSLSGDLEFLFMEGLLVTSVFSFCKVPGEQARICMGHHAYLEADI